jgi:hypothetical protein
METRAIGKVFLCNVMKVSTPTGMRRVTRLSIRTKTTLKLPTTQAVHDNPIESLSFSSHEQNLKNVILIFNSPSSDGSEVMLKNKLIEFR